MTMAHKDAMPLLGLQLHSNHHILSLYKALHARLSVCPESTAWPPPRQERLVGIALLIYRQVCL